jgi:actin related protein 2/3 complex subunit 3
LPTDFSGKALELSANATASDLPVFGSIVEEALYLYRVNVLFKSFELRGPADRTLLYSLLFLQECLAALHTARPVPGKKEAEKQLLAHASIPNFAIPGDRDFKLAALFPAPASAAEAEGLRKYLAKLRLELVKGLLSRLYPSSAADSTTPDKWWMSFAKRKFMNKTL